MKYFLTQRKEKRKREKRKMFSNSFLIKLKIVNREQWWQKGRRGESCLGWRRRWKLEDERRILNGILICQFVSISISPTSKRISTRISLEDERNSEIDTKLFASPFNDFSLYTRRQCRFSCFCDYQQISFALFFDRRKRFFHEQRK